MQLLDSTSSIHNIFLYKQLGRGDVHAQSPPSTFSQYSHKYFQTVRAKESNTQGTMSTFPTAQFQLSSSTSYFKDDKFYSPLTLALLTIYSEHLFIYLKNSCRYLIGIYKVCKLALGKNYSTLLPCTSMDDDMD